MLLGTPSLATTHPAVARQALFDATTVTASSHKKLLWRCDRNHEWQAVVSSRTRGSGCPFCANKAVLPGYNDLETTNPELAAEAQFDARTITRSSGKKLPWRCASGHEWTATAADRSSGRGCPFCAGQAVLPGFNDLATTHPRLAAEALFDPTAVTAGSSNKNLPWRCARGHEWLSTAANRKAGNGCPVCSGKSVLPGYNDLATTRPDLAVDALFDPTTVTQFSNKSVDWRCARGHEWSARVSERSNGNGCPVCSGKSVLPGYNDLATTRPDLAVDALFDPTTVTQFSSKKRPWRCAKGHQWTATVSNRSAGNDCPICAGQAVLAGYNDLATVNPDLAAEAEFDATTVTAGSRQILPWRCSLGHGWRASVSNRAKGRGCPFCAGQAVLPGFNDLQTTHPDLAREALFDPTTLNAGSNKRVAWRCTLGHEWSAGVNSRSGGNGCPVCSGKSVLPGYNDLATTRPDLVAEALFDPTTVTQFSHKKRPWRCAEGHEWRSTVANRTNVGSGCPVCAVTGFNPGGPAWLYLMGHPEWLLQQIGITNHIEDRLKKHASNGWEVLDIRGPMDGFLTQQWEASILGWLSSCNIARASSGTSESPDFGNPNAGEAWQESDLNVTSLREIMDLVEADEI